MHRLFSLLAAICALTVAATASAHAGSTKYVEAALVPGGARVSVRLDAVDAAVQLGLPPDADSRALAARSDLLRAWLGRGLSVRTDRGTCAASVASPRFGERVELDISYACPGASGSAVLRDDTVFDLDPLHETVVTVVEASERRSQVLGASRREVALGTAPTTGQTITSFVREGAEHLVTGYDHMLFLLALLLSAGPVAIARGRRTAALQVAAIVSAFTIGHSVTLAAAALGLLSLPGALVETAIAASIVLVAGLNVAKPTSAMHRPLLALGFGLVHGFGFSSVLADAGLPAGRHALALVSFNAGIELAQLGLVALVIVPLAWLAAQSFYQRVVLQGGSAVIGALACVWMVERALGA